MEKSAGIVIFRKNNVVKYLLLHYEAGHWDFPKGHVDKGETELNAAIRETREETGITELKIIDKFREKLHYFYKREGKTVYKEVVFFLAATKTNDVKISFEHLGHEWLRFEQALHKITYKSSKDILTKAHKFLNK